MKFEWDEAKANANVRKHGIAFARAALVFGDPLSRTVTDERNPDRSITIGEVDGVLVVVAHVDAESVSREAEERIRIISARSATRREGKAYRG